MHGPSEGVSEETDEANSAVKIVGGNVFVEPVSYTHHRAHENSLNLECRLVR